MEHKDPQWYRLWGSLRTHSSGRVCVLRPVESRSSATCSAATMLQSATSQRARTLWAADRGMVMRFLHTHLSWS